MATVVVSPMPLATSLSVLTGWTEELLTKVLFQFHRFIWTLMSGLTVGTLVVTV